MLILALAVLSIRSTFAAFVLAAALLAGAGCGGGDSESEADTSRLDDVRAAVDGLEGDARLERLGETGLYAGATSAADG